MRKKFKIISLVFLLGSCVDSELPTEEVIVPSEKIDIEEGDSIINLTGHWDNLSAMEFSKDGKLIASRRSVTFFDLEKKKFEPWHLTSYLVLNLTKSPVALLPRSGITFR